LIRLPFEFSIPDYLEHDIDRLIRAIDDGNKIIDCEECEIYGSVNMALMSKQITNEQAVWIRNYYVYGGYRNEAD
jgi:hypothetical protein